MLLSYQILIDFLISNLIMSYLKHLCKFSLFLLKIINKSNHNKRCDILHNFFIKTRIQTWIKKLKRITICNVEYILDLTKPT
jgi:hypothetical protein